MPESIVIVVIQTLIGPVILLLVGAFLNRRIKETKQEITNSHPMHLRDDLDGKFKLVFARQETIIDKLEDVDIKLSAHSDKLSDELTSVYTTLADHENRLTGQARKLRSLYPRTKKSA